MINLQKTKFQLTPGIIQALPNTFTFLSKKLTKITDFGSVFIGDFDSLSAAEQSDILDCSKSLKSPNFSCPQNWRFPQLLKALGAFESSNQAAKNGWNKDIPPGITEVHIRIHKIRGSLWIHKF